FIMRHAHPASSWIGESIRDSQSPPSWGRCPAGQRGARRSAGVRGTVPSTGAEPASLLLASSAVATGDFRPILLTQMAERYVRQRHSRRNGGVNRAGVAGAGLLVAASLFWAVPALALSEIQREEVPLPPEGDALGDDIERGQLPPPEMQP